MALKFHKKSTRKYKICQDFHVKKLIKDINNDPRAAMHASAPLNKNFSPEMVPRGV
jgi:hypothetical protein